jgi:hypothetical protein
MIVLVSCASRKENDAAARQAYENEINQWHIKRIEDLKADNGWLNLVGLFWLKPGINTFGSAEKNDLIFPSGKIAGEAGYFLLHDGRVTLVAKKDAGDFLVNKVKLTQQIIFHPDSVHSPLVEIGTLRFHVIKRDDKFGIRLRDLESEEVKNFQGVERYPVDDVYKVEARFEKGDSTRTIDITNIIGQTTAQRSPGTVVFQLEGEEFRLDVLDGKQEYFIVFADATSGSETYGSGRFLYIAKPGPDGKTILDFNKAYNPPCAFTPYATCPLPPKQNILSVAIKAGEKNYGHAGPHTLHAKI